MTIYDDLSTTYDSMGVSFDGGVPDMAAWTVEVAYAANPMDPISGMVWTDISQWVRSGQTTTGKMHELDQVQAGDGRFTVDNRDGRFSPWSTGPYALHTMLPIRVRAAWGSPYPVWFGYIEMVPLKWADAVNCDIDVTAVDVFKLFALAAIASPAYKDAVLADSPRAYWRLGDPPRSSQAVDASGNGYTASVQGTANFGQTGSSIVDPDTAVALGSDTTPTAVLDAGNPGPSVSGTNPFTVEAWVNIAPMDPSDGQTIISQRVDDAENFWGLSVGNFFFFGGAAGCPVFIYNVGAGSPSGSFTSPNPIDDGTWHHIVVTRAGADFTMYDNGAVVKTHTAASNPNIVAGRVILGGGSNGAGGYRYNFWSSMDEVAIYQATLTATQVGDHYAFARSGFPVESSGTRVDRILDVAEWATGDRAIEAGSSQCQGASSPLTSTAVLSYLQQVETTEDGLLFQAPDGKVTFYGRTRKLTHPTSTVSQVTVGGAPGSEPYRLDGSQLGEDDLDIWNVGQVTRVGGSTQTVEDAASRLRYGRRVWKPQSDLLCQTDAECFDRANWVVTHDKTPITRVGALPVDPRSDPAVLWPKVLSLGLQDRITFSRPTADGHTFTRDQLIEGVQHSFTPSTWRTVWNLDAAGVEPYWIWGTSTWGTGSSPTRWAY